MTVADFLRHAEIIASIGVNVCVVMYVFPMWKRSKQRFFALFGWSGMLGIFTSVASRFLESVPIEPQQYYYIWCGLVGLGIADLVLYGFAVIELVRHFKRTHAPEGGRPVEAP